MNTNEKPKANGNGNGRQTVRLEFIDPVANAVAIAGTFNDWRPEATPMISLGNGRWAKELVLPAGTYQYRFVADGRWFPDPSATASVPNPYGGVNSVLKIAPNTKSTEPGGNPKDL